MKQSTYLDRVSFYNIQLGRTLISQAEFSHNLKNAIINKNGYAVAKIGISQKHWMLYPILLEESNNKIKLKVFEKLLYFHGLKQAGIFPATSEFYLKYNNFYLNHIKHIDCLGLFLESPIEMTIEKKIIDFYQLDNQIIYYENFHPSLSSHQQDNNFGYFQYFLGKKILIICPFARICQERATQEIFEGVWGNIGRKWFFPESIDSLEFDYGFATATHQKYPTAIDLFKDIVSKIEKKDFDIALIAASGLSVPIASYVKSMNKVGIDLGGHLQFLFGVIGKRWRNQKKCQEKYFNDWWIEMPTKYKPQETGVCDSGAYW